MPWTLSVDCADPAVVAAFWARALGYVAPPPPAGHPTWEGWLASVGVPPEDWGDAAYLEDPDGQGPRLSFLRVPEPKQVKNRLHLDLHAGGGRGLEHAVRWPRVEAEVARLIDLGARVVAVEELDGTPDHVVLHDPEGNELCVL